MYNMVFRKSGAIYLFSVLMNNELLVKIVLLKTIVIISIEL